MKSRWDILYRGPLSSCNYACSYCPFAKTRNSAAELRDDAAKLVRFVDWVAAQSHREIGVLFTPWGEALVHRVYQDALAVLSRLPHVYRVSIQTNLSCQLDWIERCDKTAVALWTTFHPSQVSFGRFVGRSRALQAVGLRHSVGVVGLKEELPAIRRLRAAISPETYLWINAYKRDPDYYTEDEIRAFEEIDPLFRTNTIRHPSLDRACRAGHESFTVDGDGVVRRCHFIEAPIGNIHDPDFEETLQPRPCTNATCGCHIGYVHLESLALDMVYGDDLLARIPVSGLPIR